VLYLLYKKWKGMTIMKTEAITEYITEQLLNGGFGYNQVSFIEDVPQEPNEKNVCQYYNVIGKHGEYEVKVISEDGKGFSVYKESDEGFGDLEGGFTLSEKDDK